MITEIERAAELARWVRSEWHLGHMRRLPAGGERGLAAHEARLRALPDNYRTETRDSEPVWLTLEEALRFGVSSFRGTPRTLRRWAATAAKRGATWAEKRGKTWYVQPDEFEQQMRNRA